MTGQRISTILHAFNLREGFKPTDYTLPPRVAGNPPLTAGGTKGVTIDAEGLKKQYYEAMGFDPSTGVISTDRVKTLGIAHILPQKEL
jgi:aldehyde:ferredoxin oxidoreductase